MTTNTTPLTPLAVTVPEACRITGLGVTSIYDLLNEGRLLGHKVAGGGLSTMPACKSC
jgi:hypothetical protein